MVMRVRKEQKSALGQDGRKVVLPCPKYEGRFALAFAGTGKPAANVRYTVRRENGPPIFGMTDANGLTEVIKTPQPERCMLVVPITFVARGADGKEVQKEVKKVVVAEAVTGPVDSAIPVDVLGGAKLLAGIRFARQLDVKKGPKQPPPNRLTKAQFDNLSLDEANQAAGRATVLSLKPGASQEAKEYAAKLGGWLAQKANSEGSAASQRTQAANAEAAENPGKHADELLLNSPVAGWIAQYGDRPLQKAEGVTRVHATDAEFVHESVAEDLRRNRLTGNETDPISRAKIHNFEEDAKRIGGFVDDHGIVHLPPRFGGYFGPLHEAVHLNGSDAFLRSGRNINEGATEYFARLIAHHHGLIPAMFGVRQTEGASRAYPDQYGAICDLVQVAGVEAVAAAYFGGRSTALVTAVGQQKLVTWRNLLEQEKFGQAQRLLLFNEQPPPGAQGASH